MKPTIFIVDDDAALRQAMSSLLSSRGWGIETFASGDDFLRSFDSSKHGAVILDVRMPGTDGMSVLRVLVDRQSPTPVIMLTGHGTIPAAVQAMKLGAFDFLQKPLPPESLIEMVERALLKDASGRRSAQERAAIARKISTLTARQRAVMERLAAGESAEQIGEALKLSVKTVYAHRQRVMSKLGVESLVELTKATALIGK